MIRKISAKSAFAATARTPAAIRQRLRMRLRRRLRRLLQTAFPRCLKR